MNKKEKNRRLKYGALATVITVLGVLLVLAANLLMDKLSEKYGWSVDLTADERYAISQTTIDFLEGLEQDVTIQVMKDEESLATGSYYVVQAYQVMMNYSRYSDHVKLEFVDLVNNPTFASKYPDLDLGAWDILIQSGDRKEVVAFSQMYDYSDDGSWITASRVEEKMTNAIQSVISEEKARITVLTGYGETSPEDLINLLEANQFEVTSQSLLTEEIDPDAESAILFAPQNDLESTSLKKLDAWLENDGAQGKNLFVFLDPNSAAMPNLEAFLNEWGIGMEEGFAFEANSSLYYEKPYYPVAQYANTEYADSISGNGLTILALCRPVTTIFESKDNYTTDVLLQFTATSGVLPPDADTVSQENITGDVKGMVMSSHSWYGSDVSTSRVVVSGSAMAFTGGLMTSGTFANADYILGLFRKLGSQSGSVTIVPKDLTYTTHSMTSAQANVAVWALMIILPVLVLVIGIVVWLRRKHR